VGSSGSYVTALYGSGKTVVFVQFSSDSLGLSSKKAKNTTNSSNKLLLLLSGRSSKGFVNPPKVQKSKQKRPPLSQ
jgi:hypothetical protein